MKRLPSCLALLVSCVLACSSSTPRSEQPPGGGEPGEENGGEGGSAGSKTGGSGGSAGGAGGTAPQAGQGNAAGRGGVGGSDVTPVVTAGAGAKLPADVSSKDLIGYWSFDEGSGSVAKDSSGNGNDAALVSGTTITALSPVTQPTWTEGKHNKAIRLDGQSQFLDVKKSPSIDATGETSYVSMGAWVRMRGFTNAERPFRFVFNRCENTTRNEQFGLGFENGAPVGSIHFSFALATRVFPLNEWHHLAGTYDSLVFTLYVDGEVAATQDIGWPVSIDTTDLTIGAGQNGQEIIENIDGDIDEAYLFSRTLTAAEVASMAK